MSPSNEHMLQNELIQSNRIKTLTIKWFHDST